MYFYCDLHMFMIHRSLCLNKETITKLNIYVYVQLTLWHTNISGTIYRPKTGKHGPNCIRYYLCKDGR